MAEWTATAESLAAMSELDPSSKAVVQIDNADVPGTDFDLHLEGTIQSHFGYVDLEDHTSDDAPNIFVVALPEPSDSTSVDARCRRIRDVVGRVTNLMSPGAVLLLIGPDDLATELAFDEAAPGRAQRVPDEILSIDSNDPSRLYGLWQRPSPNLANRLGHFELPWLRVHRVGEGRYCVELWTGDNATTHGHPLLQGRLPRPLGALHDLVARAIDYAVAQGARRLLLSYHGDFVAGFLTQGWTPRKSGLIRPVRRLKRAASGFQKLLCVRERPEHGPVWDSLKVAELDSCSPLAEFG